jgi:NADH:ubiquinone oxidoreductase subunit 4 (subunit M)
MCVGILYDRYKTRVIEYYGGLGSVMPIFSLLFFILTAANMGVPGTSSFVGEILILVALVKVNSLVALLGATGMVLGAVYSIWLYNRVIFGQIKDPFINFYEDLQYEIDPQSGMDRETFMLMPLIFLVFVIGIYPNTILDSLHGAVYRIVELQNLVR